MFFKKSKVFFAAKSQKAGFVNFQVEDVGRIDDLDVLTAIAREVEKLKPEYGKLIIISWQRME